MWKHLAILFCLVMKCTIYFCIFPQVKKVDCGCDKGWASDLTQIRLLSFGHKHQLHRCKFMVFATSRLLGTSLLQIRPFGVSAAEVFYKQKAWSSILAEFRCSLVKSTWYSGSRYVAANPGGIISDFSFFFMRSISIVSSGVAIYSYDSMVSWPSNVLPEVSALSWSFVVSVRTGVKDSTAVSINLSSERCY